MHQKFLMRNGEKLEVSKYDYLVVGAGLCGSVFANLMASRGKKVLVIDKKDHIGGTCATDQFENIEIHKYGAHIFRTNDEFVWHYLNNIEKFNNFVNRPIANYNGEIYNLPFNMNTFNKLWGVITPEEAKKKIEEQCVKNDNPKNLEEHVLATVGRDIYTKLIKDYTEKQWGRSCKELSKDIMKRIPLRFTYDNNYYNAKFQGVPEGSYMHLFEGLLKNCDVILGVDYNENREQYNGLANKIFYTGSIDELFDYKFGLLEYRSLRFEQDILEMENYQGNAVVNYTDKTPYTRIIEHKHFKNTENDKTVVTREYPEKWDITKERFYPINDEKNQDIYNKYKLLADADKNLIICGKLAEYKYYDMNDTILSAMKKFMDEITN